MAGLLALSQRHGLTASQYLRSTVKALAAGDSDAALRLLEDLFTALGLPKDASRTDMVNAIDLLYEAAVGGSGQAPIDPIGESAASPKPKSKLSAATLAELKKRGLTVERFEALKKDAVRSAPAKAPARAPAPVAKLSAKMLAELHKRGLTVEQFEALKKDAIVTRR
jgi:hypothetical protein